MNPACAYNCIRMYKDMTLGWAPVTCCLYQRLWKSVIWFKGSDGETQV